MISGDELAILVEAANAHDQRAWERLFGDFTPTIQSIARRHRLSPFDLDEVVQRTWVAVVRHIGGVHNAASIGGWIATIARRECLAVIRDRAREIPSDVLHENKSPQIEADEALIRDQRRETVWLVASKLPARQRALLAALAAEPQLSQKQVSDRLGIPLGSIGPTRQRCFERMRKDPRIIGLLDSGGPARPPARPVRPELEVT